MKFAPNVVNQRQQNQGAAAAANGAPAPAAAPPAAAPEERQKALLGEHLYMRISKTQPQLAGKITGMLLELDNTEVLHLIEDTGALDAKVNEALLALQQATGN